MDVEANRIEYNPDDHRSYLNLLAQLLIPHDYLRKMDESDLIQEVQTKAIKKAEQFRGDTTYQYKAWLRQILKNTLLDVLKKKELPHQSISRVDQVVHDTESSICSILSKDELLEELAKAIDSLPDHWKKTVVLHYIEHRTVDEIAIELQQTRAATAGYIRRALEQLRQNRMLEGLFKGK